MALYIQLFFRNFSVRYQHIFRLFDERHINHVSSEDEGSFTGKFVFPEFFDQLRGPFNPLLTRRKSLVNNGNL